MIGEELNTTQYLLHNRFNGANTNDGSLGVTLTNVSAPVFGTVDGKFGGAMTINGNDRIDITENAGLNITNNLFAKYWIKTSDGTNNALLSNIYWTTGVNISGFLLTANGLGSCALNSGSGPQGAFASTNIYDGVWHFIVCSHNTTNGGKIWVDGKLDAVNTAYKTAPGYKSGMKQSYGAWFDYTGSVWYYGNLSVDELCFGQRAEPTDAEVRKWYAWSKGKYL